MSITAQKIVERALKSFGDRIAIVDGDLNLSYDRLNERTAKLANALRALGTGPSRSVAIYLPNSFHFLEIDLACMRAGITRVGINERLTAQECSFIVGHSQSAVLVTNTRLMAKLDRGLFDALEHIILVDGKEDGGTEADYESVISRSSGSLSVAPVAQDHPAYILYTSGTTGYPKGALHTHGSRALAMINMLASETKADSSSAMMHCGSLTHGSGSKALTFVALGARNVVLPKFDPELVAATQRETDGSHTFVVPTMIRMLLDSGANVRDAVRSMKQISFGGAPISNALFGEAIEELGPIFTQVYGTSEAPHPITVLKPSDYMDRPDPSEMAMTAGRAAHLSEILISDNDGKPVAIGEEGELLVRSPHFMARYWDDEEATAKVFDDEGWYRTGDVAVIAEDGFMSLRDRKRDLIISGGLNVYPSEVERVLSEHESIKEVAVIGYPDPHWGESVMACVVCRPGTQLGESELIDWVGSHLAGYKKPRRVQFMDELPKGSTNKILKRELKKIYWGDQQRGIN